MNYVAQRDIDGKTRRIVIGAVAEMMFGDAKKAAADVLLQLRQGNDPRADKQARAEAAKTEAEAGKTLREVAEQFFEARRDLRDKSRKSYRDGLAHLESWLDKPMRDITREMVEKRHKEIAEEVAGRKKGGGSASANGAMRTLRAIWNFAADRIPNFPTNPVRLRKQWFVEKRREGHVRSEDLPAFYKAIQTLSSDVQRDYLTLLLFTGMRRSEAASLTWDDIDLDAKTLRIPGDRTKPGRDLRLPLSDVVYSMLKARRSLGKTAYVFPSSSRSGHVEEPKYPLALVAETCGIHVSAHDLRRTFITVAESCGVDGYALKALVNHSLGNDITGGYVQMSPDRLREPVQRVTDKLKVLCTSKKKTSRRRKPII
jgi:integrase